MVSAWCSNPRFILFLTMETQELADILEHRGIKPTAMRLLVLRSFYEVSGTLTLRDLEELLFPADRSTIFRTLTLFERHHLLHLVDDGGGATRYELCTSHRHVDDDDRHLHFRCLQCGRTICLHDYLIPQVTLPEGFVIQHVNYIVTGLCPDCNKDAAN